MKLPLLAGQRTLMFSHRAAPAKALAPKSRETVNRPLLTLTLLWVKVDPTWEPPELAPYKLN